MCTPYTAADRHDIISKAVFGVEKVLTNSWHPGCSVRFEIHDGVNASNLRAVNQILEQKKANDKY